MGIALSRSPAFTQQHTPLGSRSVRKWTMTALTGQVFFKTLLLQTKFPGVMHKIQVMGGAGDWKGALLNPRVEGSQLCLEALLTLTVKEPGFKVCTEQTAVQHKPGRSTDNVNHTAKCSRRPQQPTKSFLSKWCNQRDIFNSYSITAKKINTIWCAYMLVPPFLLSPSHLCLQVLSIRILYPHIFSSNIRQPWIKLFLACTWKDSHITEYHVSLTWL